MAAVAEAKSEPIATRQAYGDALRRARPEHEEVVALDADLACLDDVGEVRQGLPRPVLQLRRRRGEHDVDGLRPRRDRQGPVRSTFAIFASGRAYDQVRLGIAHNELKVRIGASHGGVSLGEDGASHQMIEDIALMRAMPRMQVVVPADYNQAYRAVIDSYEANDAPMYLRFGRPATPIVYDEIPETLGDGVDVLREGKDISLIATGHMVWRALEAAESLEREDGVEAEVVNVSIIKPLSSAPILESLAEDRRRRHRRGAPRRRRPRRRGPHGRRRAAPGADLRGRDGRRVRPLRHRRGLHGALRPDRPRDRRPRPRGARPEADRLAPAAARPRVDLAPPRRSTRSIAITRPTDDRPRCAFAFLSWSALSRP